MSREEALLPRRLSALNMLAYAISFMVAGALLVIPAAVAWLGLPDQSGAAIAFLFALNVLAIGLGSFSTRFKFSEKYWPGYAVGTGAVFVALVAAIDGGLIWQVITNQRVDRWLVWSLIVPAFALLWLLHILT